MPSCLRSRWFIFFLLPLAVCSSVVGASNDFQLITDRPDFTESPVVVPNGSVQLESGFTWLDSDGFEEISGPEALVRWGFSRNLELRVGLPNYTEVLQGVERSGWEDASLGIKCQLGSGSKWDFSLIIEASIPTGSEHRTSDAVDPGLFLIAGTQLTEAWSIGTQFEVASSTVDGDRVGVFGGTLVFGLGVNEHTGTFFEVKAEKEERVDTTVILHHGWVYLINPALQLDAHLGAGLSDTAPDWLAGLGLSVRFD